jgi:hypothetical protein
LKAWLCRAPKRRLPDQRSAIVKSVLSCFVFLAFSGGQLLAAGPPPNVLLFLVDDLGVMDTSVPFLTDDSGRPKRYPLHEYYRTPHMERLAARGIRFNQFYAMSVCSPTRISIMTGQNAARHRTTNWINPDQDNAGPHGPPNRNWRGLRPGDVTLSALEAHRALYPVDQDGMPVRPELP